MTYYTLGIKCVDCPTAMSVSFTRERLQHLDESMGRSIRVDFTLKSVANQLGRWLFRHNGHLVTYYVRQHRDEPRARSNGFLSFTRPGSARSYIFSIKAPELMLLG